MSGGTITMLNGGVGGSFGNYLYTEMLGWYYIYLRMYHQRGMMK